MVFYHYRELSKIVFFKFLPTVTRISAKLINTPKVGEANPNSSAQNRTHVNPTHTFVCDFHLFEKNVFYKRIFFTKSCFKSLCVALIFVLWKINWKYSNRAFTVFWHTLYTNSSSKPQNSQSLVILFSSNSHDLWFFNICDQITGLWNITHH